MTNIPEDLREKAESVCMDIYMGFTPPEHVETIALALMAERERCAAIAEKQASLSQTNDYDMGWCRSARVIANAIRAGG